MFGSGAEVGDVEGAVVRRAVVADQAGAVHREDDVQLLQADVVDDLVEGALQEGRVDRADRLDALEREARRRTAPRAARRCRRRSTARASPSASMFRPVPPVIAAVMPTTRAVALRLRDHRVAEDLRVLRRRRRGARRASGGRFGRRPAGAVDDRASAWRRATSPCPRGRPPRPGAKPLPLTVWMWTTTGRSAVEAPRAARARRARDVVAVDHAHVGEVELLEEQARAPRRP